MCRVAFFVSFCSLWTGNTVSNRAKVGGFNTMDKGFEFLLDVDYVLPFSDETNEALYIGNVSCGSGFNECVTVPVKYILSGDEERIRAVVKRYKDVVYEYLKRTLYYMPIYE